jgi:hypothetical protein
MSFSMSCVLPWTQPDVARVRTAIEQALRDCAKRWPLYAEARVEPSDGDATTVAVRFPARLVEQPGWELGPATEPDVDGTYPCTFDHYEIDGAVIVSFRSNRSANREAWMTATYVLQRMTELLGGTLRNF